MREGMLAPTSTKQKDDQFAHSLQKRTACSGRFCAGPVSLKFQFMGEKKVKVVVSFQNPNFFLPNINKICGIP